MFVELTNRHGVKVHINMNHVVMMFRRPDGLTRIDFGDGEWELVKEPPKKIKKLLKEVME